MELTVDTAIAAYITLRDQEAQIKAKADEEINKLKEIRMKLAGWCKERADEQGLTQLKSPHGVIYWKIVDFAQVQDWDSTREFIVSNGFWDMLEHRVSKTAVRSYIEEHKEVPPGVNYGTRLEPNVRKPSERVDG